MSRSVEQNSELSLTEKRALLAELMRKQKKEGRSFALSFAQQRLWFLAQLEPENPSYNVPQLLSLRGTLNVKALEETINFIASRHESLRTTFQLVDGQPVQIVSDKPSATVTLIDLTEVVPNQRQHERDRVVLAEAQRPFDLTRDCLLRTTLLRVDQSQHTLLLNMHHIVSDGWSMGILTRELSTIYEAISTKSTLSLPELPIQYTDFAQWQREQLQGQVLEKQLSFWKQRLAGAPSILNLPTDRARPTTQSLKGAQVSRQLSNGLRTSLIELSQREGATLFMTLLAAFQILLFKYSGQPDFVVGSPIAGRNRLETEKLIGFFVNTLALRADLSGDPTFRELLGRVKEFSLAAYTNQELPFEKLVEELNPERSVAFTPLFQVMFALQNVPREPVKLGGLTVTRVPVRSETAKFDLTLFVSETVTGLSCLLEYNTDLFEKETAARALRHLEVLLEHIVADPDRRLSALNLLDDAERHHLVIELNDTRQDFTCAQGIHKRFEEQVHRTPDRAAVVFGNQELSYSELNRQSNRMARYLKRRGVGPDVVVGICIERSFEMIVALLAVLKAGGAYLPLDASYPEQRLLFMLRDSRARILLTQENLRHRFPQDCAEVLSVKQERAAIAAEYDDHVESNNTPENLAYIMYTSGSTGEPKGVGVTHRGVIRLVKNTNYAKLDPEETFLQFAPLTFDASTFEIWGALLNGARLVLMSPGLPSLRELAKTIQHEKVTTLWLTAGLFHQMVVTHLDQLRGLRQILAGGDVLSPRIVERAVGELGCSVINGYGPTENTTFTCCYRAETGERFEINVPIGRPIANTQVYILDGSLQPVPVGIPGELHIGGDGLARGYLNDQSLTAEKFIPDPFSETGGRLYRTGDKARYLSDGRIDFLGRVDHQVKIRGYRIEPGEIESVLEHHPKVQRAVVISQTDTNGEKRLACFVVPSQESSDLPRELLEYLKAKLPEYMVPGSLTLLDRIPLTDIGKIDRQRLLELEQLPQAPNGYLPPRSDVEQRLTMIWAKVLNRDRIGVRDNFFDLGGHSMLAVKLMALIEQEFCRQLPLMTLFQHGTVESIAELLGKDADGISWPTLVQIQAGNELRARLFCVSAPNVNALGYRSLARYLGPDQPVYGLQAQYPEDLEGEHSQTAVDDLATDYLKALLSLQPRGPYQMIGLCRGAHIAFEMARRLEQQGAHVAFLGIVDTWVMENTYNQFLYVRDYYRRLKARLRSARFRDNLVFFRGKARSTITNLNPAKPAPSRPGKNERNPLQIYFPGADFVPKTFNGRISVFRARRQPLDRIRDKALAWGRLAKGGVDVHFVPGSHGTVLKEPFVRGLAEEINTCLLKEPNP